MTRVSRRSEVDLARLSSEALGEIYSESRRIAGTLLYEVWTRRLAATAEQHYVTIRNVNASEAQIRFAQGYIAAVERAIMSLEEITKAAARRSHEERNDE